VRANIDDYFSEFPFSLKVRGADVPRIAGLQPIYIFRQMYSIQHWTRTGESVEGSREEFV
jgi:cytochrome c553